MGTRRLRLPWYRWYPGDWLNDEAVSLMTIAQEGAYRRLLDHQWWEGSIPSDLRALAQLTKTTPEAFAADFWPAISPPFRSGGGLSPPPRSSVVGGIDPFGPPRARPAHEDHARGLRRGLLAGDLPSLQALPMRSHWQAFEPETRGGPQGGRGGAREEVEGWLGRSGRSMEGAEDRT